MIALFDPRLGVYVASRGLGRFGFGVTREAACVALTLASLPRFRRAAAASA